MIWRMLVLAGGLIGAGGAAQFPEFSQQYVQRLGGAVDALEQVVADFDASAEASGFDRAHALEQMQGTAFLDNRRADMTRSFTRFGVLSSDLAVFEPAGPFMRAYHVGRMDGQIARAAWADFQPAMPLNFAGLVFAGTGFVLGIGLISMLLGTLNGLLGAARSKEQRPQQHRLTPRSKRRILNAKQTPKRRS
ncbi:MAG: DUF2937 family protein [Paracoccaceae bacterium]